MSGLDDERDSSGDESHRGFGSIHESDRRSLANLDQLDRADTVAQLTPVVDNVGYVQEDYIPRSPTYAGAMSGFGDERDSSGDDSHGGI